MARNRENLEGGRLRVRGVRGEGGGGTGVCCVQFATRLQCRRSSTLPPARPEIVKFAQPRRPTQPHRERGRERERERERERPLLILILAVTVTLRGPSLRQRLLARLPQRRNHPAAPPRSRPPARPHASRRPFAGHERERDRARLRGCGHAPRPARGADFARLAHRRPRRAAPTAASTRPPAGRRSRQAARQHCREPARPCATERLWARPSAGQRR